MIHARPLALAEATAAVRAPDATERWSAVAGEPVLVVDLGGASRVDPAEVAAAAPALAALPCPTLALAPAELAPEAEAFARTWDVRVAGRAGLAPVLAGLEASPLAAAGAAQCLRAGRRAAGRTSSRGSCSSRSSTRRSSPAPSSPRGSALARLRARGRRPRGPPCAAPARTACCA